MQSNQAETIWTDYTTAFASKDAKSLKNIWHSEGHITVVYPLEGMPAITASTDYVNSLAGLFQAISKVKITDITIEQTTNSNVFFAKYNLSVEVPNKPTYYNTILARVELRDGKIYEITEYFNGFAYQAFLKNLGVIQ